MTKRKASLINYGLDLKREKAEQDGTEWQFGAASASCLALIPVGEREKYLPKGEVQQGQDDTMDCASRAPINELEAKFNFALTNKIFSASGESWLRQNGYVTENGVEFSDAFIAILSETTRQGNSLKAPIQAIHEFGLVPKKLLPLESSMTWEEYHNPERITPEIKELGKQFKQRFPINYEQVKEKKYKDLLEKDILIVASYAWPSPVNGVYPRTIDAPNHAYIIFDFPEWRAFDNYIDSADGDFIKSLAPDYDFLDYGYRIYIKEEVIINGNTMPTSVKPKLDSQTIRGWVKLVIPITFRLLGVLGINILPEDQDASTESLILIVENALYLWGLYDVYQGRHNVGDLAAAWTKKK